METSTDPAGLSERYSVLLEIGRTLTGTLSDDELYTAIYRETAKVMEADGFYVSLYDQESDRATIVFWADGGECRRSSLFYVGSESSVLRNGVPTMVSDNLGDQALLALGHEAGRVTRSSIAAPLRIRERIVGAISAQSYRPFAYSRSDMELLAGIADLAAIATQNASHIAELERRRREAENMEGIVRALASSLEVSKVLSRITEAACDLFAAEWAIVWLLESGRARVAAAKGKAPEVGTEIPISGEAINQLHATRRPLRLEELAPDPGALHELREKLHVRSALTAPLPLVDGISGALMVGTAEESPFSEEDFHLIDRLAGHAAVALHNAHHHENLQALSLTDSLTKLPNRRHLEMHLSREIAAAQRGRRLSVVLFDLDNFKQYNDTLGHLAGDAVLEAMGQVLATETRAMNLVARYGGDEFVAVLSDTPLEGARLHATRVREQVAKHPALGPHGITASAGAYEYGTDTVTIKDLLRGADEDMYRAKARKDLV
jgi:diguanylate cyclase (GGDEF)-like protein